MAAPVAGTSGIFSPDGTIVATGGGSTVGLSTAGVGVPVSSPGDPQTIFVITPTVGQQMDLRSGTAAVPDVNPQPAIKVTRTLSLSTSQVQGDGGEQLAAIEGIAVGLSTSQVQPVGVYGGAITKATANSPADAVGVYGYAKSMGTGNSVGMGGFFGGRAGPNSAGSKANAVQLAVFNQIGSAVAVNTTGFSQISGIWMWADGSTPGATSTAACGIEMGNPLGTQFLVGIHFNGQVTNSLTGPVQTASIQDDGNATTSIVINGTHTKAMTVATTAGPVILGGNTAINGSSLLEVQSTSAADPLITIGNASIGVAISVRLRNGSGNCAWFIAGGANNFLTGTAAGDSGLQASASGKRVMLGGTTIVVSVTNSNTLGFFGVTEVAKQTAATNTTTTAAGSTTNVFTNTTFPGASGSTAYTIGDIVSALKAYGLLTA